MVMKHWRQDWTYEDTDLHVYKGKSTWEQETKPAADTRGKWTQAVFQVDDSPRYEVVGKWSHQGGMSTWNSDTCWRPLPRREFSVAAITMSCKAPTKSPSLPPDGCTSSATRKSPSPTSKPW